MPFIENHVSLVAFLFGAYASVHGVLAIDKPCNASSCPAGYQCEGVLTAVPDATKYCVADPRSLLKPSKCASPSGENQCCNDGDCFNATARDNGSCDVYPGSPECVPYPEFFNLCIYDECSEATECPAGKACVQGGAFAFRRNTCVTARCQRDVDCPQSSRCLALGITVSNTTSYNWCDSDLRSGGFFCVRPDSECSNSDDCSGYSYCAYNTTRGEPQCIHGDPPPPSPAPVPLIARTVV